MKLLVLSSRFPLPLEKGDKLRLYHQIKYLSKSHQIILVTLAEKPFDQSLVREMQDYCAEIYVIPHDRLSNMINAIRGIWSGLPVNVGYFYDTTTRRKIDGIVEKTRPDYIYVQLLRMAPYVRKINSVEKAIDYMDAFSLRVLRRSLQSGWFMKWLWNIETRFLQKQERQVANLFKHRFIIAETDRSFLTGENIVDGLTILQNGVDTTYYQLDKAVEKRYDLVFVGNMSYHPNILAAEYLVEKIVKPLRIRMPNLTLLIAGADPAPSIQKLVGKGVEVSGFIPDIRDAYKAGKVFVAPIFAGSGMQNKILEAMAMQLPCVTSPQVIEGIGNVHDLVFGASNAEEFIDHIERLLADEALRLQIGAAGRDYIVRNFSWEACCKPLDQLDKD